MPTGGILLIVFLVVIIVLAVISDKNAGKKFLAKIENDYKIKDTYTDFMITENNELLYKLGSGTLPGFKLWNLSDIADVKFTKIGGTAHFSICDTSGKPMKGTYLTPSKKPLKEKAYSSFPLRGGQSEEEIVGFIKKYAPNIGA